MRGWVVIELAIDRRERNSGLTTDLCISGPSKDFEMRMSGESLLVIVFVGIVAGWLAGQIVRGGGFGLIGDLIVGVLGAFVASWLFPSLGLHLGTGIVSEIIYAAIGAIVLLLIVRLISGRGRLS